MSKEANASQPLIGRESTTVPGRFGEPLTVEHSVTSRGGFDQHAAHPLFLCLHGWGSSEEDMADIMRLIAPYNDFVALRGPLTLAPAREGSLDPGNYAWFHDALPIGDDRDYDAYAAATAVDRWVADNIPADRDVVPLGFSQGGLVAVHLLRINPERYRAVVSLSGFNAPGQVPGTAPRRLSSGRLRYPRVLYVRQERWRNPKIRTVRHRRLAGRAYVAENQELPRSGSQCES